jgi:hypothetical protein
MVSKKLAASGVALACAACCAPLVVPLVWPILVGAGIVGSGAAWAGWIAGLSLDAILCGGMALAAATGAAAWYRQSRKARAAAVQNPVDGAMCNLQSCGPNAEVHAQDRKPVLR